MPVASFQTSFSVDASCMYALENCGYVLDYDPTTQRFFANPCTDPLRKILSRPENSV